MSALEGFPLPVTARHDENGNHIPPYIKEWREAADPDSPRHDPERGIRGSEVERDQKQQLQFHEHLKEHRRRGEPAVVIENT
jgi:hypothetical protein